ncbi:MAG: hypothetical protein WCS99_20560 [Limisphaerales bacterium]
MKPLAHPFRIALAIATAFVMASGVALAADKKDEKKADDKKKPDAKKAVDPKAADKDAKPVTNAVPLVVVFPKAAFNMALDAGRDPFFPTSKRRIPKAPEPPRPPPAGNTNKIVIKPAEPGNPPPVVDTNPVVPSPPQAELTGSANLGLRGISGGRTRRYANIYSGVKTYDFTKGEELLIRLPGDKQLKVRCVEIGERSARFQIEGEKQIKELFLREGL